MVAGGVGLARGSTTVGGVRGSKSGPVFAGVLAGVKPDGLRSFSLEAQYEPFEIQNPQRDERYSSLSVVASGYLGPLGLGLGWQQRFWAGSDIWVESDGGLALQLTLSLPTGSAGKWGIAPEIFARFSGGDEISSSSFGARVLLGRHFR